MLSSFVPQYFQTAEDLGLYGVDPTITNTKSKAFVATGVVHAAHILKHSHCSTHCSTFSCLWERLHAQVVLVQLALPSWCMIVLLAY